MASDTVVRRSSLPGWGLCSIYIPLTSALCAGVMLALDLLWQSLASRGVIEREDIVIQAIMMLVSTAAVAATLLLVLLLFRAVFKVKPTRFADHKGRRIKTISLFCVAYFLFLFFYVQISPFEGVTRGQVDPSLFGPMLGYLLAADWPIRSLLNPAGSPLKGSKVAGDV